MTEIVNAPVSIQSLLYQEPSTTPPDTTVQGTQTQSSPVVGLQQITADQTTATTGRGLSAATLGLTRPRGSGNAEADLVLVRQLLDDLRSDLKTNELFANAERRTTALGDALAVLQSLEENLARAVFLEADTEAAKVRTETAKENYDQASLVTQAARSEFNTYVGDVYDPLVKQIADTRAENVTLQQRVDDINNTLLPGEQQKKIAAENQLGAAVNPAPGTIRYDLASQRNEKARIDALVNAEPDPVKKEAIRTQNNYTGVLSEISRLEGLETEKKGIIDDAAKAISDYQQEVLSKSATIETNEGNIATWEGTLRTVVAPEKARLEGILEEAAAVEQVMKGRYDAADSYEKSIPEQLAIALGNFNAALAVIGVFIARLSTGSGSLEIGLAAELLNLKEGNLGTIRQLADFLDKARDALIADSTIKNAIRNETNDLGEVRKTKVSLAFSAIFTSLQEALNNLANGIEASTGAQEKSKGRVRFAIGGSA
ncbi:hypothetical protein [Aquibium sp. ELW1220]|uniref:hypothetical protein n=1 Tax=Aquibium sp. ELW1220 TaxID=2976766 RepID=UPI0025B071F7|nr:hypothetical protein [Aquibium sp. ELW1220]MDN2581428.1 hypothetical protein [Aquibium sp. ELW1220]